MRMLYPWALVEYLAFCKLCIIKAESCEDCDYLAVAPGVGRFYLQIKAWLSQRSLSTHALRGRGVSQISVM